MVARLPGTHFDRPFDDEFPHSLLAWCDNGARKLGSPRPSMHRFHWSRPNCRNPGLVEEPPEGAGVPFSCWNARAPRGILGAPGQRERGMITAHADVVGSLLRPPWLLEAQERLRAGEITRSAYKSIEDRAVDEAVAQQEDAGLTVLTDGEMRRLSFQSQMVQAVDGFGEWDLAAFLWGEWHGHDEVGDSRRERPKDLGVVAPLRRRRSLAGE